MKPKQNQTHVLKIPLDLSRASEIYQLEDGSTLVKGSSRKGKHDPFGFEASKRLSVATTQKKEQEMAQLNNEIDIEALIEIRQLLENQPANYKGSKQIDIPHSLYPAHEHRLAIRLAEGLEHIVEGWDIVIVTGEEVTPLGSSFHNLWLQIAKLALEEKSKHMMAG